ncbi:MAG: ROK family transcriptional regulator [Anaerolineales bacterium]|nr:ROK family transcriptional regulator [Anaerolineales bacterium]
MIDSPTSIKDINRFRLLNLLRQEPGLSRSEIVERTGLGKATVSSMVSELMAENLVVEGGTVEQLEGAGRPPIMLRLNPLAVLAIGVELTGSQCIAVLTDIYSKPLDVIRRQMVDTSVQSVINLITNVVDDLLIDRDRSRLLGLGVGVPGPVDSERQRVILAENIGWVDTPLGSLLSEHLSLPVALLKRQNAGAIGEYWHGVGKTYENLLYVSIGLGIGSGLVLHGELYEGCNGSAGEIGHITILPDGHRCSCGNYGCLETLASYSAMSVHAKQELRKGRHSVLIEWTKGLFESVTGPMIIKAAIDGDTLAIEVIKEACRYLGIAIANAINLYNPSAVILGGRIVDLGDCVLESIKEEVHRRAFSIPSSCARIMLSKLGDTAASIGAATVILDRFFK